MTQLVTKGRFLSLMLTRFLRLVGTLQRRHRLRHLTGIRVTYNQNRYTVGRLGRHKLTNAVHASSTRTITKTGRPDRVIGGLTTKGHRLTYDQNSANYDDIVVQVHYDDTATSNFAAHIRTAGLTVIDGLQVTTLDLNLLAHFLDKLSNFQRTNIRRTQIDRINSHRLGKAVRLQLNMRNISRVRTKDKHKRHHRVQISVNRTLQFFRGLHRISRVSRLFTRAKNNRLLRFGYIARQQRVNGRFTYNLSIRLLLNKTNADATKGPYRLLTDRVTTLNFTRVNLTVTFRTLRRVYKVTTLRQLSRTVISFPRQFTSLIRRPTVINRRRRDTLTFKPTILRVFNGPISDSRIRVINKLIGYGGVPVLRRRSNRVNTTALTTKRKTSLNVRTRTTRRYLSSFAKDIVKHPFMINTPLGYNFTGNNIIVGKVALIGRTRHRSTALYRTTKVQLLDATRRIRRHKFTITILTSSTSTITLRGALHRVDRSNFNNRDRQGIFRSGIVDQRSSPV